MFTPDGRLLQVEYACRAASHSSPLVALKYTDHLILMTASRRHRLLIYESQNVVVAMSGVLADSMALLKILQGEAETELRLYGQSLSALRMAATIGDACQKHAFGGGLRPYGSTMLVCSSHQVFQTDPSGAVSSVDFHKDELVVIGGTEARQAQLKNEIQKQGHKESLRETLEVVAKALLQKDHQQGREESPRWLEAVVISPQDGVHRLTDEQIQSLIQAAGKES